jgi:CHASE2 domain-containing sensor protein
VNSVVVFLSAFGVAAMGGLATLLRSDLPITRKSVATSMLNCGLLGLGISLLWYSQFQDNLFFLVGLCVVAGLGGNASIDFAVDMFRKMLATKLGVSTSSEGKGPTP